MRKIVLALASVAALGLAIPAMTAPAEARDVVIIKKKLATTTMIAAITMAGTSTGTITMGTITTARRW
jgi:hypothetical protein